MKAHIIYAAGLCVAGFAANGAYAQAANTEAATGGDTGALQEIVVTAQRRAENLQRVPIAVTAITGDAAGKVGITNTQDLTTFAPGLMAQSQAASIQLYMRGVGTDASSAGTENAVAAFIDGVYVPSMASLLFSFNNIQRIEVLKGPQGTLYGRNATGGAINIVTKDPSAETHVDAQMGYGNLQRVESQFYATTGKEGVGAASIAAIYSDQAKGAGTDIVTGKDINKDRQLGVNGKILLTPGDRLEVRLSGIYTHVVTSYGLSYRPVGNTTLFDGITGFSGGFYDIRTDLTPKLTSDFYLGSARIDYDLDFAKLVSISSYQDFKAHYVYDNDASAIPLVHVNYFGQIDRAYSQELQLQSQGGGPLTWVGGLFYFHDKAGYDPFQLTGLAVGGLLSNKSIQTTRSVAAFGQATYEFMPGTRLTAGIRYTKDRRVLNFSDNLSTAAFTAKSSKGAPTWRLSLDHQITPDIMVYASYSRGFKSGVFSTAAPTNPPVNPEKLDDWEAGVKTELFDKHLRLNINGFYYKYKDIQFAIYKNVGNPLINAAAAKIYGVDVDAQLAVNRQLSFTASMEALHSDYSSFPNAPTTVPNTAGPGNVIITCPPYPADSSGGCPASNASGNQLVKAPKIVFNTAVDYRIPLGAAGELETNLSYYYNDGFYFSPDNRIRQPHYNLVNGSLTWTNAAKTLHVTGWIKNLTKEKYYVQITEQALGDTGQVGQPRMYGVRVGVSF